MREVADRPDAPIALAVCIPARNEAARLPRLFEALDRLVVPPEARVTICLLLDSCTDDSAAVAADLASRARHAVQVATGRGSAANAGIARHAAMALGLAVLAADDGILLTTDADSWPRADWIVATIAALRKADLVAGAVIRHRSASAEAQDRIERYYARLFALRRHIDPVPWEAPMPHHHASGANMAMRASTYRALGGFAPLASGEDGRLLDDASRAGLRVRRDPASVVHTSNRRRGRVDGGLATALRMLDATGHEGVRLTHPVDQLWQYRHHALARQTFTAGEFAALARTIGLTVGHVLGVARDCPNAEAFAMRVVPEVPGGMRQVPFATAEQALATLMVGATPAQAA